MVEKLLINTDSMLKRKLNIHVKMTTFEKVTAFIIFSSVVLLMFATIYTKTMVDSVNQSIETIRTQTKTMTIENQLLQQKIDNLMTSERIESVATQYGLTRNINNVKSIQK